MNDSIQAIKEIIPGVLTHCRTPETLKRDQLMNEWPALVGARIAVHTKPFLTHRGGLVVWVDQPSLAYELSQKYRQALLKRVQAFLGDEAVNAIRFRVGQLR